MLRLRTGDGEADLDIGVLAFVFDLTGEGNLNLTGDGNLNLTGDADLGLDLTATGEEDLTDAIGDNALDDALDDVRDADLEINPNLCKCSTNVLYVVTNASLSGL